MLVVFADLFAGEKTLLLYFELGKWIRLREWQKIATKKL